jgi:hypothetical protein
MIISRRLYVNAFSGPDLNRIGLPPRDTAKSLSEAVTCGVVIGEDVPACLREAGGAPAKRWKFLR